MQPLTTQPSTSQTSYNASNANQTRSVSSLRGATHATQSSTSSPTYHHAYPSSSRVPGSTYGLTSSNPPSTTTYSVQRLMQKSLAEAPSFSPSNSFVTANSGGSILDSVPSTSYPSGYSSNNSYLNQTAPPAPLSSSSSLLQGPPHGVLSRPPMASQSSVTSPRSLMAIATMPMPRATPAASVSPSLPSFDTARPSSAHLRLQQQQQQQYQMSPSSVMSQPQWSGYSYSLSGPGNLPSPSNVTQTPTTATTRQASSFSLSPQPSGTSYSLSQHQLAYQSQQQQQQQQQYQQQQYLRDVEPQRQGIKPTYSSTTPLIPTISETSPSSSSYVSTKSHSSQPPPTATHHYQHQYQSNQPAAASVARPMQGQVLTKQSLSSDSREKQPTPQRSPSVPRQASSASAAPSSTTTKATAAVPTTTQKPSITSKALEADLAGSRGSGSSSSISSTLTTAPRSNASSVTSSSNATQTSSSHDTRSHASATITAHASHPSFRLPTLSEALKQLTATPSQGMGCVGLQNLGNTCFLNSILQSLNAIPELVACMLLARNGHNSGFCKWGQKAIAAPAYAEFVNAIWSSSPYSAISPNAFLRRIAKIDPRWGEGGQQDSQEFLHSLLGALQSDTNRVLTKPKYRELDGKGSEAQQAEAAAVYAREWHDSVVDDIFGGLLQSTIQCRTCGKESHTFEPFVDLSIPIPSSSKSSNVSLQECLNSFTATESLEGADSYKCEGCKSCQPHTKRLRIYRYPRILILTLKRFASRGSTGTSIFSRFRSTQKNGTAISLPDEDSASRGEIEVGREEGPTPRSSTTGSQGGSLDLSPYCNPQGLRSQLLSSPQSGHLDMQSSSVLDSWPSLPPSYRLVAVSNHSGSLEGGHYTAVAQGAMDGAWYNFNDASVRKESRAPGGPSSSAYVLFYRLAGL